ncbi:hypothetical protein D3C76_924240 [compost metagenome]
MYYNQKAQEYLAFFIDRIIDTPFYFWVGYVPHRGRLYNLENGADLQHYFNLDESLVYEISSHDKTQCMNYFKRLVDNRLNYYFRDLPINYATLFNNDHKFEMLVLASMGNSRDFGTMLLDCWTEYQAYRTNPLSPGRPYKYISDSMIVASIKKNGDKKFSNIRDDKTLLFVWKDLENFCINRKSSHFAIEELKENFDVMYNEVYSALIYHRLLHFRKGHVSPKEPTFPNKLSIYALNYAGIYDLHAKERKITFITDYDSIHDKVRRYIYNPVTVIENIRIREGELFPCKSCSNNINVTKMKAAWEKNSCPFCGGIIYNV